MNYNKLTLIIVSSTIFTTLTVNAQSYKIVDTSQEVCYDSIDVIICPEPGISFYGQMRSMTVMLPHIKTTETEP
jgi:hypothetical protein